MRGIIGELKATEAGITVVDMEAGLELFGRGTPGPSDLLIGVVEPSLWSIQTAMRISELATELGIPKMVAVANKVREEADVAWIRDALEPLGVKVVAVVPYDAVVHEADRTMRSLVDIGADSEAARAIACVVDFVEAEIRATEAPAEANGEAGPADVAAAAKAKADDGCPWVVDKY